VIILKSDALFGKKKNWMKSYLKNKYPKVCGFWAINNYNPARAYGNWRKLRMHTYRRIAILFE